MMTAFNNKSLRTEYSSVYSQTEGRGEPQNLDLAAISRGIVQTGLQNLAKFFEENCGL